MQKNNIIPTRQLLLRAVRAFILPHKVIPSIKNDERLNYWLVIPSLLAWGYCYGFLHFRFIHKIWIWKVFPPDMVRNIVLTFTISSLGCWLMTICGFWFLAQGFKREVTVYQLEVAAFLIWFLWALMPVVDALHLLNFPMRTFLLGRFKSGTVILMGHAGWLVFPFMVLELFFICKVLIGFRNSPWFKNLFLAIGIVLFTRLVVESVGELFVSALANLGTGLQFWGVYVWLGILTLLTFGSFRLWLALKWRIALGIFLMFVFMLSFLFSWAVFVGEDFGIVKAMEKLKNF